MTDKGTSFESTFNNWYKMFLEEEKKLTEQVAIAKKQKDEKLEKARKEAKEFLKVYEKEQRENLEASKLKIQSSSGKGEDLDKKYKKEIEDIHNNFKANKSAAINYLVDKVFDVSLDLPDSIIKKSLVKRK